ncbi:MAG: deoxyribonuclease V [Dehalococcoidia bacterium]|nr:deoxyribonuclease V [Dehalococcoidia bacterium]
MIARQLHDWDLTTREAVHLQEQLAPLVSAVEAPDNFRLIAGVDVSVQRLRGEGTAAVVVLDYPGLELHEVKVVHGNVPFPYVPGLLSFRELPLVLQAFEQLTVTPELVLVDGQGLAHPRRFGIAAHLGLLLDVPTIGCAKSRLIGTYEEPGVEAGSNSDLKDGDEVVGAVVRTRSGTKPVYVSIGHKVSLSQAIRWVLMSTCGFRIPEPLRLAHRTAGGLLCGQPVVSNA